MSSESFDCQWCGKKIIIGDDYRGCSHHSVIQLMLDDLHESYTPPLVKNEGYKQGTMADLFKKAGISDVG